MFLICFFLSLLLANKKNFHTNFRVSHRSDQSCGIYIAEYLVSHTGTISPSWTKVSLQKKKKKMCDCISVR